MADNRHPPHVSVEYVTKNANSEQESNTIQPGQPSPPPTEVDQESGAETEGTELVSPPTGQVPSVSAHAGPEIGAQEVIVRGVAAITMAHMLEMDSVWDMVSGEPVPIDVARTIPDRVFIDFEALREHTEQLEPDTVTELIAALPAQAPERVNVEATAKRAFTKGAAGPGVTVKHIPGLVRVEVTGPVTLQKSKQGETRILQVKYKTVETPTGHAGVTPQPVQVTRAHIQNPHQVTTRRHQVKRTVPRIPPPVSEAPPPKEEPTPEPDLSDDEYTF